jgi:glycosyltransferase involved in cell wall biosynthesis
MKPKFTIIFPVAQNVHLIKDVGQIANALGEHHDFDSTLVCYKKSKSYPYLKTEAKHLKLDFISPKGKILFLEKAVLNHLKQHAKQIDVLQLFHLTKETIYYALYFAFLNKKGKIYVKMDVYNETLEHDVIYSKKPIFQWIHKKAEKQFLKKITVISAENPTSLMLLKQKFPQLKDKAILVTNGVNGSFLKTNFPTINTFEEKENIILSVGRIGAVDKNYEMLLDAFVLAKLTGWKLILVGPIEIAFQEKVNQLFIENPTLKTQIELVGNVEDRISLYNYYNRSKLFCLSSPQESFGIAFVEAMYFGNYLIGTTGMSSFEYIANNFVHGAWVNPNDTNKLSELLKETTTNQLLIERNRLPAHQRVINYFCWEKVVSTLLKRLL